MSGAGHEALSAFRRAAQRGAILWLALLGLVGVSMLVARMLRGTGLPLELAIAAAQVALIATFFMQLHSARPLVRLTAAAAFVFLLSMFSLTFCDLFTRI